MPTCPIAKAKPLKFSEATGAKLVSFVLINYQANTKKV